MPGRRRHRSKEDRHHRRNRRSRHLSRDLSVHGTTDRSSVDRSKHRKSKRAARSPSYDSFVSSSSDDRVEEDRYSTKQHRKRHRKLSADKERQKKHGGSRLPDGSTSEKTEKMKTKRVEAKPDTELEKNEKYASISGGGDISLSIEETNKLRAKIGLKPLVVNMEESERKQGEPANDVHAPALNIGELKRQDKLRQKLKDKREKRELEEKISNVKKLGRDVDNDTDMSTREWTDHLMRKMKEKEIAVKSESNLSKAEDDFGLGRLTEDERQRQVAQQYSAANLKGLKVEHSHSDIKTGSSVILTLKDSAVLDNEDDVLVNVNIVDDVEAKRNAELRKKKLAYNAYNDEENTGLLSKYDEEIEGRKMDAFFIGEDGEVDAEEEQIRLEARAKLEQTAMSLSTDFLRPALDYHTRDDVKVPKFKKSKRKIRREILKADDLLRAMRDSEFQQQQQQNTDLGRRGERCFDQAVTKPITKATFQPLAEYMSDDSSDEHVDPTPIAGGDVPLSDPEEFHVAPVTRSRNKLSVAETIARKLSKSRGKYDDEAADEVQTTMTFDSMSEFCKTLGDLPTFGSSSSGKEPVLNNDGDILTESDQLAHQSNSGDGAEFVDMGRNNEAEDLSKDNVILDEEPVINAGLSGAVHLAKVKGYLDKEKIRQDARLGKQKISVQHYTIEDRNNYDIDDKFSRKEKYSGPLIEFREKQRYMPNVNLEYLGDAGRKMSNKEAFRYLSHRFHGKGSGKKKTEKRMVKVKEEGTMQNMNSVDTPLNTVSLLQDKQKELQQPYITLSASKKETSQLLRKL